MVLVTIKDAAVLLTFDMILVLLCWRFDGWVVGCSCGCFFFFLYQSGERGRWHPGKSLFYQKTPPDHGKRTPPPGVRGTASGCVVLSRIKDITPPWTFARTILVFMGVPDILFWSMVLHLMKKGKQVIEERMPAGEAVLSKFRSCVCMLFSLFTGRYRHGGREPLLEIFC